jgi:hypothetical protein
MQELYHDIFQKNKGFQKTCQRIVHSHACALQVMVKDSVGNGSKLNSNRPAKSIGPAPPGHAEGAEIRPRDGVTAAV